MTNLKKLVLNVFCNIKGGQLVSAKLEQITKKKIMMKKIGGGKMFSSMKIKDNSKYLNNKNTRSAL
ncbi:hypothetical protein [Ornithobacterium rhinotracheale]|uniref:hypothetical protein n=1 Tax=Ornithobacterium rhinotracheale TaxID=28251 RepID=UPI0040357AE1